MSIYGVPPELTQAAEAEAEVLWSELKKDMPDSIDLKLVKPHVMAALVLAYCEGASLVTKQGMETLKRMSDKEPRPPSN